MSVSSKSVVAYIALGSNLGDRHGLIRAALDALEALPGIHVKRVSNLLENPAVGGPAGSPPFLNAAAEIDTTLNPHALLRSLFQIERDLGRERRERNSPRTIDLDLLLYGDQIIDTQDLRVPHPRMHERDFVLVPLAEIAPEAVHPALGQTITQLLRGIRSS